MLTKVASSESHSDRANGARKKPENTSELRLRYTRVMIQRHAAPRHGRARFAEQERDKKKEGKRYRSWARSRLLTPLHPSYETRHWQVLSFLRLRQSF